MATYIQYYKLQKYVEGQPVQEFMKGEVVKEDWWPTMGSCEQNDQPTWEIVNNEFICEQNETTYTKYQKLQKYVGGEPYQPEEFDKGEIISEGNITTSTSQSGTYKNVVGNYNLTTTTHDCGETYEATKEDGVAEKLYMNLLYNGETIVDYNNNIIGNTLHMDVGTNWTTDEEGNLYFFKTDKTTGTFSLYLYNFESESFTLEQEGTNSHFKTHDVYSGYNLYHKSENIFINYIKNGSDTDGTITVQMYKFKFYNGLGTINVSPIYHDKSNTYTLSAQQMLYFNYPYLYATNLKVNVNDKTIYSSYVNKPNGLYNVKNNNTYLIKQNAVNVPEYEWQMLDLTKIDNTNNAIISGTTQFINDVFKYPFNLEHSSFVYSRDLYSYININSEMPVVIFVVDTSYYDSIKLLPEGVYESDARTRIAQITTSTSTYYIPWESDYNYGKYRLYGVKEMWNGQLKALYLINNNWVSIIVPFIDQP